MIQVVAFDLNNTVFDVSSRPRGEIASYGQHLRTCHENNVWLPWDYPSEWESLPAHPDAKEGIAKLRAKGLRCVTLSNNPMPLQVAQSERNGIEWDGIVPLEAFQTYKPNPAAYLAVCRTWMVQPAQVCMVTANESFGDLQAAKALGMSPVLIRSESTTWAHSADIVTLAEQCF